MNTTAEQPFTPGEGLVHTAIENGFAAKRGVEFISVSNGGTSATVRWAGQTHNVLLTELSRPQAPTHPPHMAAWLTTPKPPTPPTEHQLDERLTAARAELQRAHAHAKQCQSAVEAARQIAVRAGREVEQARAALATLDRVDAASLADLEAALRENREPPPVRNGVDRNYIKQHLDRAEQASLTLNGELAAAQAALGEALSSVRAKARAVLSVIFAREAELLRQAELRCALTRSELTKISEWWPTQEGHLSLPPATAGFIAQMPHWADLPEIRQQSGSVAPWERLHSRLVAEGDAFADFELGE
jgi:hypothetical protein